MVHWGFSGDLLYPNSLLPITNLIIVFASVFGRFPSALLHTVFGVVLFENLSLCMGQFLIHESFGYVGLSLGQVIGFALASLAPILLWDFVFYVFWQKGANA